MCSCTMHNLYLNSDILQLADVMQLFRKETLKTKKLEPCFYVSHLGLSYDVVLPEGSIRGGVACISKKFARANHEYFIEYNPETGTHGMGAAKPNVLFARYR